jgi:Tfp pilus assembly protein PilV
MSFLEVVVCLFIVSEIFLGLLMIQTKLMNRVFAMRSYSIANQQVSNLQEYLKITTTLEREHAISAWITETKNKLQQGQVLISKETNRQEFKLFWGGMTPTDCTRTTLEKNGCLYVLL